MEQQLIQTFKGKDADKRLPVVRLEIDYELVSLHDAMLTENLVEISECKNRLNVLREELLQLER